MSFSGALFGQLSSPISHSFGASDATIGDALAITRLGALFALFAIAIADRRGRRRSILIGVVGSAIACALSAVAPNLFTFTSVQVLQRGLVGTTATVAFLAVVEEAPEGARAYAASMLALAGGFGFSFSVVALPLADVASWGWRLPFAIGGATILMAPVVARSMAETARYAALTARTDVVRGRVRDVFERHRRRFVLLGVVAFLTSAFSAPSSQFMNQYLIDVHRFTNTDIAVFRAITTGVPGLIGVVLGGRVAEARGRRPVAAIALALATGSQMIFFLGGGLTLWVDVGGLDLHGRDGRDRARHARRRALPDGGALDVERDVVRRRRARVRVRAPARGRPGACARRARPLGRADGHRIVARGAPRRPAAPGIGGSIARRCQPDADHRSGPLRSPTVTRTTTVILDGLAFPEGPRWHAGRLWFSDQHDRRIVAMAVDGTAETIVELPQQPSGLGWLPDGRMLAVSMLDRKVMRLEPDGSLVVHADLAALAPGACNDMVVGPGGRAYVGNFGFDMYAGEKPKPTCVIGVEPDGTARVAADGLGFPNGSVITPDGRTLLVGETMASRIGAFDIADDGTLGERRDWATLEGATVDGMCLDAEGAIWSACPFSGRVLRIRAGGEIVDEVKGTHPGAFACMLGGVDRRTLYVCTAPTHVPDEARVAHGGRIEAVTVDVPGAGWP